VLDNSFKLISTLFTENARLEMRLSRSQGTLSVRDSRDHSPLPRLQKEIQSLRGYKKMIEELEEESSCSSFASTKKL